MQSRTTPESPKWTDVATIFIRSMGIIATVSLGYVTLYYNSADFRQFVDRFFYPPTVPTPTPTPRSIPSATPTTPIKLPKTQEERLSADQPEKIACLPKPTDIQSKVRPRPATPSATSGESSMIASEANVFEEISQTERARSRLPETNLPEADTESAPTLVPIMPVIRESVEIRAVPPVLLKKVLPEYPKLARDARIWGKVEIGYTVLEDGSVGEAHKLHGNPVLAEAAIKALLRWTFTPAREGNLSAKHTAKITFQFNL